MRKILSFVVISLGLLAMPLLSQSAAYPPELAPMVVPIEEVEAMMAGGTFKGGAFALDVEPKAASDFSNVIKQKLRTAKAEYTRMPRAVRLSKEADDQWYRMDALIKTSNGFSDALQAHSRALKQIEADAMAAAAAKQQGETTASTTAPAPITAPWLITA